MKSIEFNILSNRSKELIIEAIKVREFAYCPYSNFKVGAALLDERNQIHTGCNVESVDFTLTSHAEMVAIDSMVKSGSREIKEIAIAMQTQYNCVPCGLCRQKMIEFANKRNFPIICVNLNDKCEIIDIYSTSMQELLPYAFDSFEG